MRILAIVPTFLIWYVRAQFLITIAEILEQFRVFLRLLRWVLFRVTEEGQFVELLLQNS